MRSWNEGNEIQLPRTKVDGEFRSMQVRFWDVCFPWLVFLGMQVLIRSWDTLWLADRTDGIVVESCR